MSTPPASPVAAAVEPQPSSLGAAMNPARARGPWVWMTIACVFLAAAVATRIWQHRRFEREEEQGIAPLPFDLQALPTMVGPYRSQEGIDFRLDRETIRYAGGLDHLVRTYTDESTGGRLLVLVLYGRADRVVEHIPELCYSGAGYAQYEPSTDRRITFQVGDGETQTGLFRTAVFTKPLGVGPLTREQAYYAFRYKDQWSPQNPLTGKNRRPFGIFKIQVQRRMGETEKRDFSNKSQSNTSPVEEFLTEFLPSFERIMAAQASSAAVP